MNQVVDEVLQSDPRYTITYNDNSTATGVQISLETPVVTQGTALNKALFDSIQSDITSLNNNKLNVSAKATQTQAQTGTDNTNYMTALRNQQHYTYNQSTQAEAEAGTNNVHYMTPLRVQQKLDSLITSASGGSTGTIDLSGFTNKIVTIYGYAKYSSSSSTYSRLIGTGIHYYGTHTSSSSSTTYCNFNTYTASTLYPAFRIMIDFNTKTFTIQSTCYTSSNSVYADTTCGTFSTLTSVSFSLGNTGSWATTMQVSN